MQHVRKTRRAECEGVLTTISAALERAYSVNNGKYPDAATGNKPPNNAPGACPLDGGTTFYNITYATASASQEFTLTATPQNDQVKDVCGTLTLKHTGEKSPTPTTCWK
ncbi:MAG: type IV pilin protein [Zoogloeaceae bacterium]|nr:type IV pilin protein [Zoogloeaceae bacterium]